MFIELKNKNCIQKGCVLATFLGLFSLKSWITLYKCLQKDKSDILLPWCLQKFPNCSYASKGSSVYPSFVRCESLFDLIRSPVACISLWPLLASLFSPVDDSKSVKVNWVVRWVLLAQSCRCPQVQALWNDSSGGTLHLSDWVTISQKLH